MMNNQTAVSVVFGIFLIILCCVSAALCGVDVPLIPRKVIFANPARYNPMISPGGVRIAYLAPSKEGVMNIWVSSAGKKDDRQVTNDTRRGVFEFLWGYSDDHILFFQDNDGDENDHLKSVDLRKGAIKDLTPFKDVRATNLSTE